MWLKKDEYHRHATAAKNIRRIRNPAVGKKVGKGSLRNWAANGSNAKDLGMTWGFSRLQAETPIFVSVNCTRIYLTNSVLECKYMYHVYWHLYCLSLLWQLKHYIYIKYGSGPAPVPVEEKWKQPTTTALAWSTRATWVESCAFLRQEWRQGEVGLRDQQVQKLDKFFSNKPS